VGAEASQGKVLVELVRWCRLAVRSVALRVRAGARWVLCSDQPALRRPAGRQIGASGRLPLLAADWELAVARPTPDPAA